MPRTPPDSFIMKYGQQEYIVVKRGNDYSLCDKGAKLPKTATHSAKDVTGYVNSTNCIYIKNILHPDIFEKHLDKMKCAGPVDM